MAATLRDSGLRLRPKGYGPETQAEVSAVGRKPCRCGWPLCLGGALGRCGQDGLVLSETGGAVGRCRLLVYFGLGGTGIPVCANLWCKSHLVPKAVVQAWLCRSLVQGEVRPTRGALGLG